MFITFKSTNNEKMEKVDKRLGVTHDTAIQCNIMFLFFWKLLVTREMLMIT